MALSLLGLHSKSELSAQKLTQSWDMVLKYAGLQLVMCDRFVMSCENATADESAMSTFSLAGDGSAMPSNVQWRVVNN